MALETITKEEFDTRLEASNVRLRQEIQEAQERIHCLDDLIQRKEAFSQKLDNILLDIEQEETDIALAERQLLPRRTLRNRRAKQLV